MRPIASWGDHDHGAAWRSSAAIGVVKMAAAVAKLPTETINRVEAAARRGTREATSNNYDILTQEWWSNLLK